MLGTEREKEKENENENEKKDGSCRNLVHSEQEVENGTCTKG